MACLLLQNTKIHNNITIHTKGTSMQNLRKSFITAFFATLCAFASSANASLLGDTISGSGTSLTTMNGTIGNQVEFQGIAGYVTFDFGANTLTIGSHNGLINWNGFGNYVFTGFDLPITSLTLLSNSGFNADFISNYSFTANSITLNMNSGAVADWQLGSNAVFNITVPEPESYALLLASLGALGVISRRKQRV